MHEHTTDDSLSRRDALKGLAGLAATSGLAGCISDVAPTRSLPGSYKRDVLRYGQVLPPLSLDPVEAEDPWSGQVIRRVFQSLYVFDRDLELRPVLADGPPEWSQSTDGKGPRVTVPLRDGPTFQDGSEVTAADVRYTFEAIDREGTARRWLVDAISEVRAPDPRTVEFHLEHPYPNFPETLTQPIVPKTAREENTEAFGKEYAVGSGPYEPSVFREGKYAVLERWADYWGEAKPRVNWLKFVQVHSGLARTMSLRTGQNDIVERVQPKFWNATAEFPGTRVQAVPGYTSYYLGFNTTGDPTASPRVREAVDYLLSMDEFVADVVGKAGRRQYSPLPPQVAAAWDFPVEEWASIPHRRNRTRARTLLKQELKRLDVSGWSPKIAAPKHDLVAQKLAKKLAHEFRVAGFRNTRTKAYHWREFGETVTSGNQHDYEMFVAPRTGGPDPDSYLYPMVHENMQGLTNGTYYNDERVMEAIDRARRTTDHAARKRHYEMAITGLLEDRAVIPAFTLHTSFGVKSHVGGFEPHPLPAYNPLALSPDGEPSLVRDRSG